MAFTPPRPRRPRVFISPAFRRAPERELPAAEFDEACENLLTRMTQREVDAFERFRDFSRSPDVFEYVQRWYIRYLYTSLAGEVLDVPVQGEGGMWGMWVQPANRTNEVDVQLLPFMWVAWVKRMGAPGIDESLPHHTIQCDEYILEDNIISPDDSWYAAVRMVEGKLEWMEAPYVQTYKRSCRPPDCRFKLVPFAVIGPDGSHAIDIYLDTQEQHILVFNTNGPEEYDPSSLREEIRNVLIIMDAAYGGTYWMDTFGPALEATDGNYDEGEYAGLPFRSAGVGAQVFLSAHGIVGCRDDCLWQALALLTGMMTQNAILHPSERISGNQHTWTMFLQGACMAVKNRVAEANELAFKVRIARKAVEDEQARIADKARILAEEDSMRLAEGLDYKDWTRQIKRRQDETAAAIAAAAAAIRTMQIGTQSQLSAQPAFGTWLKL